MVQHKGKHILLVDDERTIREVLRRYLEREDFYVSEAGSGQSALKQMEREPADLVVLDLMLPGMSGYEVARMLRATSRVPIVMLTAKGELDDRIEGLEVGADDYVVKPFSPREVTLRVKAVLRRWEEGTIDAGEPVERGDLRLDPATREGTRGGDVLQLTAKEFELLYYLMQNPGQVFQRDQLLDQVWGYDFHGDASTVTVHIRRLREKIERNPSEPEKLLTVWGVGYKFVE